MQSEREREEFEWLPQKPLSEWDREGGKFLFMN